MLGYPRGGGVPVNVPAGPGARRRFVGQMCASGEALLAAHATILASPKGGESRPNRCMRERATSRTGGRWWPVCRGGAPRRPTHRLGILGPHGGGLEFNGRSTRHPYSRRSKASMTRSSFRSTSPRRRSRSRSGARSLAPASPRGAPPSGGSAWTADGCRFVPRDPSDGSRGAIGPRTEPSGATARLA
jgi:hypothetical protein